VTSTLDPPATPTATPTTASTASRARLRADVLVAARLLPVARPLADFVAVNPLSGFEHLRFADAVHQSADLFGTIGHLGEARYRELARSGRITADDVLAVAPAGTTLATLLDGPVVPPGARRRLTPAERHDRAHGTDLRAAVDAHTVRWCAAFLDQGQASWPMPGRADGLYAAWRRLAVHDATLPDHVRRHVRALPTTADEALAEAVDAFSGAYEDRRDLLVAELTALPGWAAHVRWRAEAIGDVDLVDYVALRLSFERAILGPAVDHLAHLPSPSPAPSTAAAERALVWQAALERHEHSALLEAIAERPAPESQPLRPVAQLVCCIDVRSEGLRRHLEGTGPYETLGFAGFFAVAIEWHPLSGGDALANCPALVQPRHVAGPAGDDHAVARYRHRLHGQAGAVDALHRAKDTPGTAFVLAEAAGWLTGPAAAARTALPRHWAKARRGQRRRLTEPPTTVQLDGFPEQDRLATARTALRMMGLTTTFAPLVVLCGHSSETAANPYEAALRCGACGGHGGGPNARVLAAILNDPVVRAGLLDDGIAVPDDTYFAAAEHDTTTDEVTILDPALVPTTHHVALTRLRHDLAIAGRALAAERCATLPGAPTTRDGLAAGRHVQRRAADWAETFPEWGLAGNTAFVIGPRSMTHGLDLQRRVFLHSYDDGADPTGTLLETILTAPLVVAQWINCQYYFSSTDPDLFGSGTKTVHNPVGSIGVLAGRTGDLRLGLPSQSVATGRTLAHEPLRLLAVVQAPLDTVAEIIDRNSGLRDLLTGQWVTLTARATPEQAWSTWTAEGWTATTTTDEGC